MGDQHTKGPWFCQPGFLTVYSLSNGRTGLTCALASILTKQLAEDGREAEAEGNARLIAAAPTMFEYIASSASAGCATARKIVDEITNPTSPALPEPTEGKLK